MDDSPTATHSIHESLYVKGGRSGGFQPPTASFFGNLAAGSHRYGKKDICL